MTLTPAQQIQTLIAEKKHILIVCPKYADGDMIGSALALWLWLGKKDKLTDVVISDFTLPSVYRFLKGSHVIKPQLPPLQKFVLTVDVRDCGMETLTYDVKDEKLRIFITPKQGVLSRERVRTAQSDWLYDLVITIGAPDLESLGSVFGDNSELFGKIPVINIDHQTANERFGHINYLDPTATTTAEIIFEFLNSAGGEFIDTDIATALLTAIIAKTHSFKSEATKPRLLTLASKLIELGANRDGIVTALFRTRTVGTLKLWGTTLRHLQHDRTIGLIWSTLTREDFARAGAHETDLADVIDELITNAREANIIVLLHEHPNNGAVHGLIVGRSAGNGVGARLRPQRTRNQGFF